MYILCVSICICILCRYIYTDGEWRERQLQYHCDSITILRNCALMTVWLCGQSRYIPSLGPCLKRQLDFVPEPCREFRTALGYSEAECCAWLGSHRLHTKSKLPSTWSSPRNRTQNQVCHSFLAVLIWKSQGQVSKLCLLQQKPEWSPSPAPHCPRSPAGGPWPSTSLS